MKMTRGFKNWQTGTLVTKISQLRNKLKAKRDRYLASTQLIQKELIDVMYELDQHRRVIVDPIIWKSADGRETPIQELEDEHLQNIINLLETWERSRTGILGFMLAEKARRTNNDITIPRGAYTEAAANGMDEDD